MANQPGLNPIGLPRPVFQGAPGLPPGLAQLQRQPAPAQVPQQAGAAHRHPGPAAPQLGAQHAQRQPAPAVGQVPQQHRAQLRQPVPAAAQIPQQHGAQQRQPGPHQLGVIQQPQNLPPAAQQPPPVAPVAHQPPPVAPAAQQPPPVAPAAQQPPPVAPAAQQPPPVAPAAQQLQPQQHPLAAAQQPPPVAAQHLPHAVAQQLPPVVQPLLAPQPALGGQVYQGQYGQYPPFYHNFQQDPNHYPYPLQDPNLQQAQNLFQYPQQNPNQYFQDAQNIFQNFGEHGEDFVNQRIDQEQKKLSLLFDAKIQHLQKSEIKLKDGQSQERFNRWNIAESKVKTLQVAVDSSQFDLSTTLLQDLLDFVQKNQRDIILQDLGPEGNSKLSQLRDFKKYQEYGLFKNKEDIKLFREFSKSNNGPNVSHSNVGTFKQINPALSQLQYGGSTDVNGNGQFLVTLPGQHGAVFSTPQQFGDFIATGQSTAGPVRRSQNQGRSFGPFKPGRKYPPNPAKDTIGGFLYCDLCRSSATDHTTWQCNSFARHDVAYGNNGQEQARLFDRRALVQAPQTQQPANHPVAPAIIPVAPPNINNGP